MKRKGKIMAGTQVETITGTGTIDVHVNTNTGSVTVNPPSVILGAEGAKVNYSLSFEAGSPNQSGVRAYVVLRQHNIVSPATSNNGYQDTVFAIVDEEGDALTPTFIAESQGEARLLVVVAFPEGTPHVNQEVESVVIVDW